MTDQLPEMLVLWDIDHTLIENGGVSKATYASAFELLTGIAPQVRPTTHGRTDFLILRELFSANGVDAAPYVSRFGPALVDAMTQNAPNLPRLGYVLPGVIDALTALYGAPSVVQSVLTGNIAPNARVKLESFDLDKWVDLDVGGFGSDDEIRSNLVDVARKKVAQKYGRIFDESSTVLVGDTPLDVKAAQDGGAKVIAVATGVHSASELVEAGANVVLNDLTDFLAALLDVQG